MQYFFCGCSIWTVCPCLLTDIQIISPILSLRIYAAEKGIGSFWIGAQFKHDTWIKSNNKNLSVIDVNVTNDWSEGKCIIADGGDDYQHKVVSCDSTAAVSMMSLKKWF